MRTSWEGISYGNVGIAMDTAHDWYYRRWVKYTSDPEANDCLSPKGGTFTEFSPDAASSYEIIKLGQQYNFPNIGDYDTPFYLGPAVRVSPLIAMDAVLS